MWRTATQLTHKHLFKIGFVHTGVRVLGRICPKRRICFETPARVLCNKNRLADGLLLYATDCA